MKFYEYITFLIIGTSTIDLLWALYEQNWGAVGLSFTALFGWLNVAVYEKRDRDERNGRESYQYDV